MMNFNQEKKWLVKSENKILGPYSFDQLEDLLKKRQLSLIDEIRDTETRWLYIREMPELQSLVDNVRAELEKIGDHTKALQTSSGTLPTSQTVTTTDSADIKGTEITTTNPPHIPSFSNINVDVQDIPYSEQINPTTKNSGKMFKPNKRYISAADPKIKEEIEKRTSSSLLIVVSLIVGVVLSSAGFYAYRIYSQKKQEQALVLQVRKYQMFGLEDKAVELYQKLPEELQAQILPDIIPLLPRLESAALINAHDTIELLRQNPRLPNDKKALLELAEFNQFIGIQDLQKAKASLIKAKDLDPASDIVKEDEAILAFYENDFQQSVNLFKKLFEKKGKGRLLLGRAVATVFLNNPTEDLEIMRTIDRYVSTRIDYRKELLFVQIYLSKKMVNESRTIDYLQSFVETPVQLASHFRLPEFVPSAFYNWSKLNGLWEKMKPSLSPQQSLLLDAHIKIELGQASTAQKNYDQLSSVLQSADDKANLLMVILYGQKKYPEMLALEKTMSLAKINLASHLSLFLAKRALNVMDATFANHVQVLQNEKNLFAQWVELAMISKNEKDRMKSFLQFNSLNAEDFLPYIEAKGTVE